MFFRDDYLIGGTKQRALVDLINYVRKNNKNITKIYIRGSIYWVCTGRISILL